MVAKTKKYNKNKLTKSKKIKGGSWWWPFSSNETVEDCKKKCDDKNKQPPNEHPQSQPPTEQQVGTQVEQKTQITGGKRKKINKKSQKIKNKE
jgi:hypothetical protein